MEYTTCNVLIEATEKQVLTRGGFRKKTVQTICEGNEEIYVPKIV